MDGGDWIIDVTWTDITIQLIALVCSNMGLLTIYNIFDYDKYNVFKLYLNLHGW